MTRGPDVVDPGDATKPISGKSIGNPPPPRGRAGRSDRLGRGERLGEDGIEVASMKSLTVKLPAQPGTGLWTMMAIGVFPVRAATSAGLGEDSAARLSRVGTSSPSPGPRRLGPERLGEPVGDLVEEHPDQRRADRVGLVEARGLAVDLDPDLVERRPVAGEDPVEQVSVGPLGEAAPGEDEARVGDDVGEDGEVRAGGPLVRSTSIMVWATRISKSRPLPRGRSLAL